MDSGRRKAALAACAVMSAGSGALGSGLFAPAGFDYGQPEQAGAPEAQPAQGAAAPAQSAAQPIGPRPITRRALESVGPAGARVSFQVGYRHLFESDFEEGDGGADQGSVSVNRAAADLGFSIPVAENRFVDLGLGFERSWYSFDRAIGFVPGVEEPWGDVNELGFSAVYRVGVNERWSYFVGGLLDLSGEDGADAGDSLTYGGLLGVGYAASERLRLGLGVLVSSRLEEDVRVLPLPSVDWTISESLRLNIGGNRAGAELAWTMSESLTLALEGAWESREFRLEDENPAAPEGVVDDQRVPVGLALTWSPSRNMTLVARGGYMLWQEYELRDRGGDKIREIESDAAPYLGASLRIAF